MIYTVTLNPALDKTIVISGFLADHVNYVEQMRIDPGGKGINISKVLNGLGVQSVAMGILGGGTGQYIRECLDEYSIQHDFVVTEEPTRTNLKIVDPENHQNTDINEKGVRVSQDTVRKVMTKLMGKVVGGDIVVLAGTVPPGVNDDIYGEWTKSLHRIGGKVYLDANGMLLRNGVKAGPDLIKPNKDEFAGLVGEKKATIAEIAQAANEYVRQGIGQVVISLGGNGAVFVRQGEAIYANALKVPVKSTVGAGDAAMAAFLMGAERRESWEETIRTAIAAGAASVMCEGTQSVLLSTVENLKKSVTMEKISV